MTNAEEHVNFFNEAMDQCPNGQTEVRTYAPREDAVEDDIDYIPLAQRFALAPFSTKNHVKTKDKVKDERKHTPNSMIKKIKMKSRKQSIKSHVTS